MLRDEIDVAKRTVNTDTVQITIGELANLYAADELHITPDFQRLFRWSDDRKSNFVESILIGIPIPPAFVYEKNDGTWELIDGLQRISTVLEFMGVLKDPDTGLPKRSQLHKTKYLPSLEGVFWQREKDGEDALEKSVQLFFRRHRMDVQILKHPSDPKTKFDLFQRLNRGGAYANEQEVRTCSMVLANLEFTQALRKFAQREDFTRLCKITDEDKKTQGDLEYAVRLAVHTYKEFPKGSDVQEFLDQAILEVMDEHKKEDVIDQIGWSISTLFRLFGESALISPENQPNSISRRFSLRALEGIAVGVARNKKAILDLSHSDAFIIKKVQDFWTQPEVKGMSALGLRGSSRLQKSVPFGSTWFNPNA